MARMTSFGRARALSMVAAAGAYALALPPFDHAGLAWLTLVPLLLVVRTASPRRAFAWGALYGAFWWIASGLVLIPALRGIAPFTPAAVDVVRVASFPWLAAMIVNGLVLGGVFATLARRLTARAESGVAAPATRRAA